MLRKRNRELLAAVAFSGLAAWLLFTFALPRYHWYAAQRALEQFQADAARPHLAACLTAWPQSGEVHLLAARAERLGGEMEATQTQLQECGRLKVPAETVALEWAMLRAQNGDLDSAEEYLRYNVEHDHPDSIFILDALVRGYTRVYRFNMAQFCLKLWLERQPNSKQALLHRAHMWELVHNYQDAVKDYRHVLEVDTDCSEARLGLANSLLEVAEPAEALEQLEKLRQRQPDDPQILVRYACCLNTLNRPGEAQSVLDTVLAAHPDLTPALQGRAQVALQQGNPEEAERWAQKAMKLDPYDYQVNYLYYQCLKQCGKQKEALEQFASVERIKTSIVRMQELGNRKLQAAPNDPALRCEMGTLSIGLGQGEVGLGWLLSALQKDRDYKPAHAALADYYEHKGDSEKADYHRKLASGSPLTP
jgi:tetratricopeptide (TPR) repeat protein